MKMFIWNKFKNKGDKDCCIKYKELISYSGNKTFLEIPQGVIKIEENAFKDCKSLEKVIIPNGVKAIGDSAFANCESLEEIAIPESVIFIGRSAFENCKSLKEIDIPYGINKICAGTFAGCEALEEIKIPDSVTSIEDGTPNYGASVIKFTGAFEHCISLKEITIPQSVIYIGERAFASCKSLNEIIIPESVASLGICAFQYKKASIVLMHSSITKELEHDIEQSVCQAIFAPNLRLSDCHSEKVKSAMCLGFIKHISKTRKISDEVKEEYYNYILENEYLIKAAFDGMLDDEKILLNLTQKNLIPLESIDLLIRISVQNNTPNVTTILIEYKNKFNSENKDDFYLGTL